MNINRNFIKGAVMAMAIAAALPALAVEETTTTTVTTVQKGHHYVYYKDHDIYFAPDSKTYYWNSNGTWQSGAQLPPESRSYITSGGITVELNSADRPYEQHDYIVKHYITHDGDGDKHDRDDH